MQARAWWKETLTIAKIRDFHRDPIDGLEATSRLRIECHGLRGCSGRLINSATLLPLLWYPRCAIVSRIVWSLLGEKGGSWGLVHKGVLFAKSWLPQELCYAL